MVYFFPPALELTGVFRLVFPTVHHIWEVVGFHQIVVNVFVQKTVLALLAFQEQDYVLHALLEPLDEIVSLVPVVQNKEPVTKVSMAQVRSLPALHSQVVGVVF